VNLLAPGHLHTLTQWPGHFVYFSPDAIKCVVTAASEDSLLQGLSVAGIRPVVPDHLFIHDPDSAVFKSPDLKPHEHQFPPPFGELSARLQAYVDAGIKRPPLPATGAPATLHITHSWGGGIARWINVFIQADKSHRHFQLRSENAEAKPPAGLKLSLYAGNELRCPIASWWLQPPIESSDSTHSAVQAILTEICERYRIGRVFVSSLIGHSVDALRTGLPTVQVLHDHYPTWPLLGVNPEPYLLESGGVDLEAALSDHKDRLNFPHRSGSEWARFHADYLQALSEHDVKIVAPGQWVLDLQNRLEPAFTGLKSKVIRHGFPAMENLRVVKPRPRKDGRLRMVILGRVQEGKGSELLKRALPELTKHVQVYLLGTGKPGEQFFGLPGVNVIVEYDHSELAGLLNTVGPDIAALPSVVPETFSFTLSELQQTGIPAIATRVGSFPDRIVHDETGWLVEANADAVIRQVAELCKDPARIKAVRGNLASVTEGTPADMVKRYNRFCPPTGKVRPHAPMTADNPHVQWAAADFQHSRAGIEQRHTQAKLLLEAKLNRQWAEHEQEARQSWQTETKRLNKELEDRTTWAMQLNQDLEQERKSREMWADHLDIEINHLQDQLDQKNNELIRTVSELHATQSAFHATRSDLEIKSSHLDYLQSDYDNLAKRQEQILQSRSWKLTLPLRVLNRVVKNLVLARAWNPLRWPWLLSSLVRNLGTLGFTGTLRRLQDTQSPDAPQQAATQVPVVHAHADREPREDDDVAGRATGTSAKGSPEPDSQVQSEATWQNTTAVVPGPFVSHDQPEVSIVIPAHNQWSFTSACLTSLLKARCEHTFEVIVVDDQSSDETAGQLAQVQGIHYLRNEQNLGFVGSCNRGSEQAQGEFLVLLNNDTEVTDGWLDELIDTFQIEPQAGLVGSRLVYPDGRLQESGGIIFNDASGWNYGRGDNPEHPEYQFLREADYCSGACIILKTALFQKLGALDERYAPAYYEDTDLAFRVREAGYKVMIQPSSVVIHFEGATSGTDTSSGTKRYQLVNQQKFLDRWHDVLESQPEPVPDPYNKPAIRKACFHRKKGQILFIDARTPEPDKDSGSVRLSNLMQVCRDMDYTVAFLADNRVHAGHYTRDLQKSGIEVYFNPWLESFSEFFRGRGFEFDYIFISRHYVAINYIHMIRRYCPNSHFIFDTVDLHYLRERRLAELENSRSLKIAARQTRRSELSVVKAADATLVVSSIEKEVLAKDAPGSEVHVLSNIHHVPGRNKVFADRKDIYFVGGYQHPPNIDAAMWFVNEVWPLVHEHLPDMKFHLIGSQAPKKIKALAGNGVVFHGYVESLEPFLNGCRLAVAPLRYGAGVKGKVNMSMAHGQPVVVTSASAEGLFGEHEREFLLADDAETFAGEIVRLYQDEALWNRLSDASIKNVQKHFSVSAARDSLDALFRSLDKK
jgi:GT2 family glycosyltransferase